MNFEFNDGGREAAGYKGVANDCVVRAIAIVTKIPYKQVYGELGKVCKEERPSCSREGQSHPRKGVYRVTYQKYLETLGWLWTPTMFIGSGCKVHLKAEELPWGRVLCRVSQHVCAVIDGVIHDDHDPSRGELRCVYGYFTPA